MSKLVSSTYHSKTYDTGKVVLKKEWDALKAEDTYRLYAVYERHQDGFNGGAKSLHYISQGNREWAEKNAKHYGIEIEEQS